MTLHSNHDPFLEQTPHDLKIECFASAAPSLSLSRPLLRSACLQEPVAPKTFDFLKKKGGTSATYKLP